VEGPASQATCIKPPETIPNHPVVQEGAEGSHNSLTCKYDTDEFALIFTGMPRQHELKTFRDKHIICPFVLNLPDLSQDLTKSGFDSAYHPPNSANI